MSRPEDFFRAYDGTPPWDIGRPQRIYRELADRGGLSGRVLDVGCGTGEHALLAAELGLDATGIDTAPRAIALAKAKAAARGISARFIVGNALDLPALGEHFDTVLDCGLFHVFDDADRARFVEALAAVVPAGGRYHVLCFSDLVPGSSGPRRVRQEEIAAAFLAGWRVEAIEPARLETTFEPGSVPAWFAVLERA